MRPFLLLPRFQTWPPFQEEHYLFLPARMPNHACSLYGSFPFFHQIPRNPPLADPGKDRFFRAHAQSGLMTKHAPPSRRRSPMILLVELDPPPADCRIPSPPLRFFSVGSPAASCKALCFRPLHQPADFPIRLRSQIALSCMKVLLPFS